MTAVIIIIIIIIIVVVVVVAVVDFYIGKSSKHWGWRYNTKQE